MYGEYVNSHSPLFKTPEKYIYEKLRILRRDFHIEPTKDELYHLNKLTTQIQIDNAILGIINKHWG